MEKAYTRTNWTEDTAPFINADNLNNIENGIDAIDDRVVELSAQAENFATKDEIPEVEIMTTSKAGIGKPDGNTITADADGTLHAVGGGGTSDYNDLSNKPSINGVALSGDKSFDQLGITDEIGKQVSHVNQSLTQYVEEYVETYTPPKIEEYISNYNITISDRLDEMESDLKGYTDDEVEGLKRYVDRNMGTGETSDYEELTSKPSINGITLSGNKTLASLGIQPAGSYLTAETDPTVPSWAKSPSKPTYTASEVGADTAGSSSTALADAKDYTDSKIAALVGGAPSTLDTLKEISDALSESEEAVDAIELAIGSKLDKAGDSKDNTVTFTQASTRANISSGEKHSTLFGKIAKFFADLKAVAFSGSYDDLSNKPSIGGVTLSGNKTFSDLGINAVGVGADPFGSASNALSESKIYTDIRVEEIDEKATKAYNNAGTALSSVSVIQDTYAKKTELPVIATTGKAGTVKPDGTTITIDTDGTLHAVGGGGGGTGGTSDYNALLNKPSINGVSLQGKKTLSDLGIDDLADEKIADLHEDKLGGFTPVIDSTGKITGYKTKAGADTVFPFSKSNKFVNLNVIMSTNGSAARPVSYATRNDTDAEYFGDFETGSDMNTAKMTIKKDGTYKILFRTAYRVTQSTCTLKHNSTTIASASGNSNVAEYEITAVAGDTLNIAIASKTSGYGFQCADVIVYVA